MELGEFEPPTSWVRGTPVEKCPKSAQGGWNGFSPPKEALVVAVYPKENA